MPDIPCICDSCGHLGWFGVEIQNQPGVVVRGNRRPCPCGGTFWTLDGTYNFLRDSVTAVLTDYSMADLLRLEARLREIQASGETDKPKMLEALRRDYPRIAAILDTITDKRVSILVLYLLEMVQTVRSGGECRHEAATTEQIQVVEERAGEVSTEGPTLDLPTRD